MNKEVGVWVINLERSKDRRSLMEARLNPLRLNYEIIPAVDGEKLSDQDLLKYSENLTKKNIGRGLVPGEIGAALSHIRLWERLLQSEYDCVLILEDDAIIGKMCLELLNKIKCLPSDWELINLAASEHAEVNNDFIFDIYRIGKFKGNPFGLVCYLINKRGAERLLSHAYPIRKPVDCLTAYHNLIGLSMYGVAPRIATTQGCSVLPSTISSVDLKVNYVSNPAFLLKKILYKIIARL